jgi:hypothetical protein
MDGCSAADACGVIRKYKTNKHVSGIILNFMGNTPVSGSWFGSDFLAGCPAKR